MYGCYLNNFGLIMEKTSWIPLVISNYFLISPDFIFSYFYHSLYMKNLFCPCNLMGLLYSRSPPPWCISSADDNNYHHCFALLRTTNQIVYYTIGLRDFAERALFVTALFLVKVCNHFCPSQLMSIYHVSFSIGPLLA